jgi:hypothetical protein
VHPRTIAQLALLAVGMIVWGYGTRIDDEWLRWIGIACFAIAFVLRLLKKREATS